MLRSMKVLRAADADNDNGTCTGTGTGNTALWQYDTGSGIAAEVVVVWICE